MPKKIAVIISLLILISACKELTESENNPLIGTWTLTAMKVNGAVVSAADYSDVPVKLLLLHAGSGTVWYQSGGKDDGSASLIWSSAGNTITVKAEGEDGKSVTYSVNTTTLTITDSSNYQYIYTKQS
jgi:hypothetical protein